MSIETWLYETLTEGKNGLYAGIVFKGKQEIKEGEDEGEDEVELPSIVFRRLAGSDSVYLDGDEGATFQIYINSDKYDEVVEIEADIIEILEDSGELIDHDGGDDQASDFDFHTRLLLATVEG